MKIINYHIQPNGLIQFDLANGRTIWVCRDVHSGKIVTRKKVDTISNVQHTGIWLGTDYSTRQTLILHNHYKKGYAHISTLEQYAFEQAVYWKNEPCNNNPATTLQIALAEAKAGKPYHAILYNCQHYTNRACNSYHYSEDLAKWTAGFLGIAFTALIVQELI